MTLFIPHTVPGQAVIWTPRREVYCWPGETVEQLQVIAASMAGAGQLVALVLDGHGAPVSSRRAPAVSVATVPGQVVIWMVWCVPAAGPGSSPGGVVERLQVIAALMAGAGQLVAGSAGGHGTRTSRDLDAKEGRLQLHRVRPLGTVEQLQVILE